jgi:hypothetical protein
MKTHTVEVLIAVTQDAASKLYDGEPKFTGEYVLRAFAADGTVLHEVAQVVPELNVTTSDYARLVTLQAVLERLHAKLCGQKAWYALRVVQSSKNVDGWLDKGWKRNAAEVKALAGAADVLLKPFPRIEWVQLPRTELDARMKSGKGVMLPA